MNETKFINFYFSNESSYSAKLNSFNDKINNKQVNFCYSRKIQLLNYILKNIKKKPLIYQDNDLSNILLSSLKINNKTFFFRHFKSINNTNKNLIIILQGIGSLSSDEINQSSSLYFIVDLLNNGHDVLILYRDYLVDGKFYYKPFYFSDELNMFIDLIKDTIEFNNLNFIGISGGCLTILKFLTNLNFKENANLINLCFFISCSPNIDKNISQFNIFYNNLLKPRFKIISNKNKDYSFSFKDNMYDIIGNIGKLNFNFNSIEEYYEHLNLSNEELNNISCPVFFINSKDDNIARYEYINEYFNLCETHKYFHFIVSETGWHTTFYNDSNNFLSTLILEVI